MGFETTTAMDAASPAFGAIEASLLADALGIDLAHITARTREPLGAGSVTGLDVQAGEDALRYYVDTSRSAVATETGLATGDPAAPQARVWLHPADPHLPALGAAAFGHAAGALLARLGIGAVTAPTLVAYRPGRRAVLRVQTAQGAVWVKVVRPLRVERIVDVHRRLDAGGVPVPRVRGWAPEGLIVIEDAVGRAAPGVEWDPDRLLDAVDALRADLAKVRLEVAVRGAARRLPWYASRLALCHGEIERRTAALVDRIGQELPSVAHAEATVHGDLHYGQLFLGPEGSVAAVIDVDTSGRGQPGEDSAAFIAHAVASALITPTEQGRERVWRLADRAFSRWGDDATTHALTSVHLMGHAIGALDRGDPVKAGALIRIAESVVGGCAPSTAQPKSGLMDSFELA